MVKLGNPNLTLQAGWTIDEDENGLLTGELSYEGDWVFWTALPVSWGYGMLHPYDGRLTAYKRRVQRLKTDKVRITLSFIGIISDPTPWIIEHPGGSGQDPIETHPDFTTFAGTPSAPQNGAKFDAETGEFIGFTNPSNSLAGVTSYIVPSVIVNASYYTHFSPQLGNVGKLSGFPPIYAPPNVRNWLLIGMPYKQIGNLFQVTAQFLGSGPGGWNRRIY